MLESPKLLPYRVMQKEWKLQSDSDNSGGYRYIRHVNRCTYFIGYVDMYVRCSVLPIHFHFFKKVFSNEQKHGKLSAVVAHNNEKRVVQ